MDVSVLFEMMKVLLKEHEPEKLKFLMETLMNSLMKIEREVHNGASRYERTEDRRSYANGYKSRTIKTQRFGSLQLLHPQVRGGSEVFHSELFARYQRSEKALFIAAAEMYYKGVSTRKITDLYGKVFETEISPQFVSNAAARLDEQITAWRSEEIEESMPYIYVDAIYKKVRENKRIVSKGVLIVTGVDINGRRRIPDFAIDDTESEESYKELFDRLKARGLHGVEFVISDAHSGLKKAVEKSFHGASWQRCRLHFIRNYAKKISRKETKKEFLRLVKNIYAQESGEKALAAAQEVSTYLADNKHPELAGSFMEQVEETLQYFCTVSENEDDEPWKVKTVETACRKFSTSNQIERINGELKRRLDTIRIFPNDNSLARMVGSLLMEQDEEWRYGRIYVTFRN
ncbi:MAG TPA: IS256 family transposase [bacterium]|nr:IS256 family transposase [bacterium]